MSHPVLPVVPRGTQPDISGVLSALGCFSFWGLFPIYFKLVGTVPPLEVLAHRVLGSALILLAVLAIWKQGLALRALAERIEHGEPVSDLDHITFAPAV
jgi:chloramphenicol-sensitive protein RarD